MASKGKKLPKALGHLEEAIRQYRSSKSDLNFLTLVKAFEIAMEYAWRELKKLVEEEGLDAPAPRSAIKEAARLKLIPDPESWLLCLEARNNSVHDYFGISEAEFSELAERLVSLVKRSRLNPTLP